MPSLRQLSSHVIILYNTESTKGIQLSYFSDWCIYRYKVIVRVNKKDSVFEVHGTTSGTASSVNVSVTLYLFYNDNELIYTSTRRKPTCPTKWPYDRLTCDAMYRVLVAAVRYEHCSIVPVEHAAFLLIVETKYRNSC